MLSRRKSAKYDSYFYWKTPGITAQKPNRRLSRLVAVLREDKTFDVFPSWQRLKELTFQEAEEVVKRPQAKR